MDAQADRPIHIPARRGTSQSGRSALERIAEDGMPNIASIMAQQDFWADGALRARCRDQRRIGRLGREQPQCSACSGRGCRRRRVSPIRCETADRMRDEPSRFREEDTGGCARRYRTGEDRNLRYADLARTANLPAPPQQKRRRRARCSVIRMCTASK
jgi:hypothetical protein